MHVVRGVRVDVMVCRNDVVEMGFLGIHPEIPMTEIFMLMKDKVLLVQL